MGSEWILGRLAGGCGLDSTVSGQGPVASSCECGDEPSGSCAAKLVTLLFVRHTLHGNGVSETDTAGYMHFGETERG
jgi:hypothetical protein